ncbi:MAG: phosphotransferase [Spirochaetales bacterium]|nr:phosphotransferase [Spirochaetales bacterium]
MYRYIKKTSIELEYKHLEEIAQVFPDLEIDTVKYKDNGLIYDILFVNNELVFRFPKFEWAFDDMFKEAACLDLTRKFSNISIPAWQLHTNSFISYKRINGSALTEHEYEKFDPKQKDKLAESLGQFLKSIHSIPRQEILEADIADSLTLHSYGDWLKLYDDVQQELYSFMTSSARDTVDALFRVIIADNTFTEYQPAFINGDLTDYHLLFDAKKKKLNGIIDFGSAGIGDPATDIACLLLQYGEIFVSRIAQYYPEVPKFIDRARFIASTYPLQWALGGIRTGDNSWLLVHLGKTGNIHSIGSPIACL